jgi:hypothetical protein
LINFVADSARGALSTLEFKILDTLRVESASSRTS